MKTLSAEGLNELKEKNVTARKNYSKVIKDFLTTENKMKELKGKTVLFSIKEMVNRDYVNGNLRNELPKILNNNPTLDVCEIGTVKNKNGKEVKAIVGLAVTYK